jgi:hypothetical protein
MQLLSTYAAALIVIGQVLALVGFVLILYMAIRQRLQDRVESGEKPRRHGLPYPDLYYWHILRQRSSLGARIRRAFKRQKSEGV